MRVRNRLGGISKNDCQTDRLTLRTNLKYWIAILVIELMFFSTIKLIQPRCEPLSTRTILSSMHKQGTDLFVLGWCRSMFHISYMAVITDFKKIKTKNVVTNSDLINGFSSQRSLPHLI